MKKSISLFLTMTAVLTIVFSACGNSQSNTANAPTDMKFVEVQGPVKAIIEGSATTNFDRSGQITSIDYIRSSSLSAQPDKAAFFFLLFRGDIIARFV